MADPYLGSIRYARSAAQAIPPLAGSINQDYGSSRAVLASASRVTLFICALGLAADEVPDVVAVFEALHRLLHREVAGAGKVDAHLFADARGAGGEDDDAVAEEYRLLDVVGDEDDGLARALPELDEFFLHGLARWPVEGTERLAHHQHLGINR